MYNAHTQNTLLRIREELGSCSYDPRAKDYLANMIVRVMNFPKKKPQSQSRHFIRTMNQNKIIMVWYPMNIPFMQKFYEVPLLIYIMRNIPYEPPQIFIEVVGGSAANANNRDIDVNTNRIMTNTLRNWNQYSNIENAMNEIFSSFSNVFPIYKTSGTSNPPSQNSGYGNNLSGSGIYNVLNNAVQNSYQQNRYGPPQQKSAYQPPTHSIYGRSMTLEKKEESSNSFGGGIYGNNTNKNTNTFGGGIYGNNNNTNTNTFGGGIYGNNNNTNPNTFGGGIYGTKNNNYIPPSSNLSGNNNQNNNQYGNQWGNNNYNNHHLLFLLYLFFLYFLH